MAVVGDSRKGQRPIDLEEARRRRQQQASQECESSSNGAPVPETTSEPLWRQRFSDTVADDILRHHTEATTVLDEPAGADEILSALAQTQHTSAPPEPKGAPRGSAQLALDQPRRRRRPQATTAARLRSRHLRRRIVGAAAAIATIATAGTLILAAQPSTPGNPTHRPTAGAANGPSSAFAGTVSGAFDTIADVATQLHLPSAHAVARPPAAKRRASRIRHTRRASSPPANAATNGGTSASTSTPSSYIPYTPPAGDGQTSQPPTGSSRTQQPVFGSGGLLGPGSSPNG